MPIDDTRTAGEIREDGDEMSVVNRYTEAHLNTSQPGLTPAQRGEDGFAEPDMSMYEDEDDPRWYEDDDDPSVPELQPTLDQETFNSRLEQWAIDWTEQQQRAQDPTAAAVYDVIDSRVEEHLAGLQQAQEWALQGQADRQQRGEIRQAQQDANDLNEGTALLGQLAQATAEYHGLPPSNPDAVMGLADQLFNDQAVQYLNQGGRPEDWEGVKQQYAERCVEEAAIRLGRQQISDNALKRI